MNEDSCLTLVSLLSVKSVFLKKEDLLCISEMVYFALFSIKLCTSFSE